MTITAALKTLTGAVLGGISDAAQEKQADILTIAHVKLTAPVAAQASAIIGESIPDGGFPWSEIAGGIKAKLPVFEAQLTQALDQRAAAALTWSIALAQKWAAALSAST